MLHIPRTPAIIPTRGAKWSGRIPAPDALAATPASTPAQLVAREGRPSKIQAVKLAPKTAATVVTRVASSVVARSVPAVAKLAIKATPTTVNKAVPFDISSSLIDGSKRRCSSAKRDATPAAPATEKMTTPPAPSSTYAMSDAGLESQPPGPQTQWRMGAYTNSTQIPTNQI